MLNNKQSSKKSHLGERISGAAMGLLVGLFVAVLLSLFKAYWGGVTVQQLLIVFSATMAVVALLGWFSPKAMAKVFDAFSLPFS